jgi:hypothetical protein
VVAAFTPPKATRGTDLVATMKVVDPSCPSSGISIVLFGKTPEGTPHATATGEVVRFHRLRIDMFNSNLQGVRGKGLAVLFFDGNVGTSIEPVRSTSGTYTLHDSDRQTITALRQWTASVVSGSNLVGSATGRRRRVQQQAAES